MQQLTAFFLGVFFSVAGLFGLHKPLTISDLPVLPAAPAEATSSDAPAATPAPTPEAAAPVAVTAAPAAAKAPAAKGLSNGELLAMASNAYADGNVPLGDSKYVTDAPKKGYVYLCNIHKDNPGSMVNGPWIGQTLWNYKQKISINGSVSWPNATFGVSVSGNSRVLTGNDLPVNGTTGVFPVATSDPAHQYDANPNTIKSQMLQKSLPLSPVYSDTPYCMGGEVGVMVNGVVLFNAFDAGLRDAPAHELQDSCDGHPQGSGEYHYHSLSSCFKDISVSTVLGYALDGFPITGPEVASGKFLTTDDLDVCHGITSDVKIDGKTVTTYHYVMTQDFPYSASCFRGKPTGLQVIAGTGGPQPQGQTQTNQTSQAGMPQQGGTGGMQPPQEAIQACSGKTSGEACSFSTPMGTISGHCDTPPGSSLACVPR